MTLFLVALLAQPPAKSFPPDEATTVQLEAVRALSRISSAEDREVLTALRQLAENQGPYELDPRVVREARRAVELLQPKHGERQ